MTFRDFYTSILNTSNVSDDVKAFAETELGKLDARNEKRRTTQSANQIANEGLKDSIVAVLTTPMFASDIATAVGISTQKVSALAKQLVDSGKITVTDVKVKGKGVLKQYALAEKSKAPKGAFFCADLIQAYKTPGRSSTCTKNNNYFCTLLLLAISNSICYNITVR